MAWNGSHTTPTASSDKRPEKRGPVPRPALRYALAGGLAIVVLGSVAVLLIVGRSADKPSPLQGDNSTAQRVIAEVKPQISTNESKSVATGTRTLTEAQTVSNAARVAWIREKQKQLAKIRESGSNKPKAPYAIFNHSVENRIAGLLRTTPGAPILVAPRYSKRFVEDFKKSCNEPIIINDDDSDYDKQLKRDMIECKIDLCNRMAEGEDLAEILSTTHRELAKLGQVRQDIERMTRQEIQENAQSADDAETIIEAANKMLEAKGIAPLKVTPVLKRSLSQFSRRNHGTSGK